MVEKRRVTFGENKEFVKLPEFKRLRGDPEEGLKKVKEFFTDPGMMWRAASNRSLLGAPGNIKEYFDFNDEESKSYNPYTDPQLQPFLEIIPEQFFDSRSAIESQQRIKSLMQKMEDSKNPWFVGTSMLSEMFLDPSSFLLLSKPLRLAMLGAKANRFSKIGGIMVGEEAVKQVGDRDRTMTDAIVVGTFGILLNRLSPILSKYDKRYNKNRYDPSNDRGVVIDADDFFGATKTEVGISGLLTGPMIKSVKPGVAKNVTDFMKIMKNQYPDLNIITGKGSGKTRADGKYVPAYYNNDMNTMTLDIDGIKQMYKEGRPFKINYIDGKKIIPFKKTDFQNVDEFVDFVMRHEFSHKTMRPLKGEHRATYENRINQIAYTQILDNRNNIVRRGSTMLDDYKIIEQEKVNYYNYEKVISDQLRFDDIKYQKTGTGFEKNKILSPLNFFINNNNIVAKEYAMNMLTNSMMYGMNFNRYYSSPPSAEMLRNLEHLPRLGKVVEEGYQVTNRINQMILNKKSNFIQRSKGYMKFFTPMSPDEVFKETFYARLSGNRHEIPEIAEYAAFVGRNLYEPMAAEIRRLALYMLEPIKRNDFAQGLVNKMVKGNLQKTKVEATGETWTFEEAKKSLKSSNLDIELADFTEIPNYVNINWKFDTIILRWEGFKPLLTQALYAARKPNGKPSFDPEDIEEIVNGFMNHSAKDFPNIPKGLPPGEIYKLKAGYHSKNLKQRFLKDIDYVPLAKAGFIEDNMEMNMSFYVRSVGPDISVAKKYGDPYAFGWFYEDGKSGFAPGLQQIHEDFAIKLGKTKNKKEYNKLLDERNESLMMAEAIRELVKNKYGLEGDINSYMWKTTTLMKIFNNITMLTGFSQVADIGRIITVDGLLNTSRQLMQSFSSGIGKEVFEKGLLEARYAGQAWDTVIAYSRANIVSGNDFLNNSFTGAEKVFQEANQMMFQYGNMQNPWNVIVKTAATIGVTSKVLPLVKKLANGKKIKDWQRAYLADMGLGSQTIQEIKILKDIDRLFTKHGNGKGTKNGPLNKDTDLLSFPNTQLWKETNDDLVAAMKLRVAINKDVDFIIVTPGLADAPLIANTMLGSLIFQYKKFGLGYTNRVLMRGLQSGDGRFIQSLASLTALGMIIDGVRSQQTGAQYQNKTLREKILDGAERGGVGGIFTDIDRIIMALSDNKIGIRPTILGVKKPYGASLKRQAGAITPTGSSLGNIAEILYDWGRGKHNHHTARRIRRTIPYNNIWYADSLFDKLEKALY